MIAFQEDGLSHLFETANIGITQRNSQTVYMVYMIFFLKL